MEYYILSGIFGIAFVLETLVTGRLFIHRSSANLSAFMRWWAIIAMGFISTLNVVGYARLHVNHQINAIDPGNYVQAAFALGTINLFAWVWVFHFEIWSKKDGEVS